MPTKHKHDKPILVTGAAGAVGGVGRSLTEFLLAKGHTVRALVRREDERAEALRRLGAEVPRAAARAFNRVAWPAFAVLLATGAWNVIAARGQLHGGYAVTLWVKLAVVAVSGLTAWLHARARSRARLAAFGALTGLSALTALFLGIVLAR